MAIQNLDITVDDSILEQYDNFDSMEGLIRAALVNFDGEETRQTQKEKESKYGAGKYFGRGYNSK
jgi:hypothetical protein